MNWQTIFAFLTSPLGLTLLGGVGVFLLNKFPQLAPIAQLLRTLFDALVPAPTPKTVDAIQMLANAASASGMDSTAIKTSLKPFADHALEQVMNEK